MTRLPSNTTRTGPPSTSQEKTYLLMMVVFFEWFVALHEMQTDKLFTGRLAFADMQTEWGNIKRKVKQQFFKDYVWIPLLAALVAAYHLGRHDAKEPTV